LQGSLGKCKLEDENLQNERSEDAENNKQKMQLLLLRVF
jgi:hypothetical protein